MRAVSITSHVMFNRFKAFLRKHPNRRYEHEMHDCAIGQFAREELGLVNAMPGYFSFFNPDTGYRTEFFNFDDPRCDQVVEAIMASNTFGSLAEKLERIEV